MRAQSYHKNGVNWDEENDRGEGYTYPLLSNPPELRE